MSKKDDAGRKQNYFEIVKRDIRLKHFIFKTVTVKKREICIHIKDVDNGQSKSKIKNLLLFIPLIGKILEWLGIVE